MHIMLSPCHHAPIVHIAIVRHGFAVPSQDEEIDEDLAFTAEDKVKYAGWFGDEDKGGSEEEDEDEEGGSSDLDMNLLNSDEELEAQVGPCQHATSLCLTFACSPWCVQIASQQANELAEASTKCPRMLLQSWRMAFVYAFFLRLPC